MNLRRVPDLFDKLSLLDDSTRFEPAGGDPLGESAASTSPVAVSSSNLPQRIPKTLPCITEVSTPQGKKPIMKAMMTTACERNCFYCPFRAGRTKTQRITFTPDEMAKAFDLVHRAGLVDGMFLSSGIIKGGVTTQDKLIDTVEIVRKRYNYTGYVHLKIMPGAEYDQIRRSMQLADRVSVNLEGATPQRLQALAPKKDYWEELIQRLQWIGRLRAEEGLRASVVTQFVVGAVGDTDLELLQVSETLYRQMGLRRAYYSAFHPVDQTPFEDLAATPAQRQLRLYQASFLLRDYGWNVEELPFAGVGNLPLEIDPKLAWANANLTTPLEVNRASRDELLRVPGIGPRTADSLVRVRHAAHHQRIGAFTVCGCAGFREGRSLPASQWSCTCAATSVVHLINGNRRGAAFSHLRLQRSGEQTRERGFDPGNGVKLQRDGAGRKRCLRLSKGVDPARGNQRAGKV